MKLYVCYGTFETTPRPGGHPCGNAYHALKEAGHDPEVIKSYGLAGLPDFLNNTQGPQGGQGAHRAEQGAGAGDRRRRGRARLEGRSWRGRRRTRLELRRMKLYVCWGTFGSDGHAVRQGATTR